MAAPAASDNPVTRSDPPLEAPLFQSDVYEDAALAQYRADYRKFREGHARGAKADLGPRKRSAGEVEAAAGFSAWSGLGARAPTEPPCGSPGHDRGGELFYDALASPASSVGAAPQLIVHAQLHLQLGEDEGAAAGATSPRDAEALELLYDLGEPLGSGHFSTVRRASCRTTGRMVAVKSARSDAGGGAEAVRALSREAAVLRALGTHPHVCELLDVFESVRPAKRGVWGGGRPVRELHLVLELMRGGELFDALVAQTRFSEARAKREVRVVLRAVAHMHARGVLHRDLKVENLLYADEACSLLKVSDFGLSTRAAAHLALEHTGCGTAGYAAPEILLRRPYDGKVDVFAAGVIAYVLLSGTEPFTGDNDVQTAEQTCAGRLDFDGDEWADVSDEAMDFVTRCLAVEPSERPTAAEALQLPWLRDEGGQPS